MTINMQYQSLYGAKLLDIQKAFDHKTRMICEQKKFHIHDIWDLAKLSDVLQKRI